MKAMTSPMTRGISMSDINVPFLVLNPPAMPVVNDPILNVKLQIE